MSWTVNRMNGTPIRLALVALFTLTLAAGAAPCAGSDTLKIISWNVLYGFNHGRATRAGGHWIHAQNPDIVAFQERDEVGGVFTTNYGQIERFAFVAEGLTDREVDNEGEQNGAK